MTDPELPPSWHVAALDDVLDVLPTGGKVQQGWSPQCDKEPAGPGEWGVLKTTAIQAGAFLDQHHKRLPGHFEPRPALEVWAGDLLLTNAGPRARCAVPCLVRATRSRLMLSGKFYRFRALEALVDPRFLEFYLLSPAVQHLLDLMKTGISDSGLNLTRAKFLSLPVVVPPLDEQRRIVDLLEDHLSRLDAATALAVDARRRGHALVRRLLLDAALGRGLDDSEAEVPALNDLELGGSRPPPVPLPIGWRWMKWRDVGSSQNGRLFPSSDYQAEGLRLLRPGNMRAGGVLVWKTSATKCLPEFYGEQHPGLLLNPGDIVINLTAQSLKDDFLGRVCLVRNGDIALLNQRVARLVPSAVSPAFAMVVFRSPLFRRYVTSLNSGSLIQHMFTKQIAEFWLPVPPEPDQQLLVQRVELQTEAWSAMCQTLNRLGPRVDGARRSLLAAAFSGRLNAHPLAPEGF